jgi:hypothetical protein
MRLTAKLFASLTALLVTACAPTGPVTSGGCEWARPVYVSRSDVLTDGTARQILTHNETWRRVCGDVAPASK